MSNRKQITITVDDDVHYYLADILCWIKGYTAAKGDDFLEKSVDKLGSLNVELKATLMNNEVSNGNK